MNSANQQEKKCKKGSEMKRYTILLSIVAVVMGSILFMYKGKRHADSQLPSTPVRPERRGDEATTSTRSPLAGTWTREFNGGVVTLTLTDDGRYTVNMTGGSAADVRGRYTIDNDQVTFLDEGGPRASSLGEAVYRFTISDNRLEWTPIREPDDNRKVVIAATWTRS